MINDAKTANSITRLELIYFRLTPRDRSLPCDIVVRYICEIQRSNFARE